MRGNANAAAGGAACRPARACGEVLYEGETIPVRDWKIGAACGSTPRLYEMTLSPVVEHDQAMPIAATKSVRIEPAVEHDQAMPISASRVLRGTASAIAGPSAPHP